jgi:hypothetical protein
MLEDREQECRRLSGASLGTAEHIIALKKRGDRLSLNRCRLDIVFSGKRPLERLDEVERGEGSQERAGAKKWRA